MVRPSSGLPASTLIRAPPLPRPASLYASIVLVRPVARVTVVTPRTMAAMVSSVRPGRANGWPRPMLTGRGSRVPPRTRWTCSPRPVRGALPALIARAAESRCARSAGTSAVSRTSAGMPSRQTAETHAPTPPTAARPVSMPENATLRMGSASTLPSRVPAAEPATAGTAIIVKYTATTWFGVKPRALSMPMCRYPETTAPLTTFPTIRAETSRPRTPKSVMKGR